MAAIPSYHFSASVTAAGPQVKAPVAAGHSFSFRTLLSELNPLQYIPVIGTIYRAITGDTIPEAARDVGSFVVSGLTGGPVGMATNVAFLALEKMTGIDPEKLGSEVLRDIGIGGHATPVKMAVAAPVQAAAVMHVAEIEAPVAWSAAQLTAYGVTRGADGNLKRGAVEGSDVLNDLELARHSSLVGATV